MTPFQPSRALEGDNESRLCQIDSTKPLFSRPLKGCMTSIVLGTGNFKFYSRGRRVRLQRLLERHPHVEVDTAPSYDAEKFLGEVQRRQGASLVINTKFCLGATKPITATDIARALDESIQKLGKIETFWLHSSDPRLLTDSAWEELRTARLDGLISKVGYSGDSDFLSNALREDRFEAFMVTYNPIDNANEKLISLAESRGSEIYIKRALGSGVLSQRLGAKVRRAVKPNLKPESYEYRLKSLENHLGRKLGAADFLGFQSPAHKLVLGIHSSSQLDKIQNLRFVGVGANLQHDDSYMAWISANQSRPLT